MKTLLLLSVLVLGGYCLVSYLPPTDAGYQEAKQYFTPEEIRDGRAYSQDHRIITWIGHACHLAWLLVLVGTPVGRHLADFSLKMTRGRWLPAVWLVGLVFWCVDRCIGLPFIIAHWMVFHHWGVTRQTLTQRLLDLGLTLFVDFATSALLLTGVYLLLAFMVRWLGRRWWVGVWIGGWVAATLVGILIAFIQPVVLGPIFNNFQPLQQTQWKDQEASLRALVKRAGVEIGDIQVVDASRRDSHSNAYFTGFGPTRRIILYDNLLENQSPLEVESIVAHELGHWLHHHIVIGLVIASVAVLVGLFLLLRVWLWALGRPPLALRSPTDPAGIPLLLLLTWLGTWLVMPLENMVSRHFERQADAVSLKLGPPPQVFIDAEKKLAILNRNNLTPHPVAVWFFYTHPPAVARIQMAQEWGQKKGE